MNPTPAQENTFRIPPLPWEADVARLVVEELKRSKTSVAAFSALHGVPAHRVRYWKSKLEEVGARPAANHGLLQVRVGRVSTASNQAGPRLIEVVLPEGAVVKFREDIHPNTFALLVTACGGTQC